MRSKLGFLFILNVLVLGLNTGCPSDSDDPPAEDGGVAGAGGEGGTSGEGGEGGAAGTHTSGSGGEGGGGTGGTGGEGGGPTIEGRTTGEKIDLLFMVDNSNTMREEQAALRAQFPRLIQRLLAGVDLDGDGTLEYEGARDVHLGVVSSDLGLPGIDNVPNCNGLGDEGLLDNTASPEITGCSAETFNPPFLSYVQGTSDIDQTATDFACLATVGTEGCGFEQQLESALKAVWPGDDQRVTFLTDLEGLGATGNAGVSFPNGEFIRNDPNDLSLVAIVLVTDEEDCSSRQTDHFQVPPLADPERAMQGLNLRCYYESLKPDGNIFAIDRYTQLFKMLRPGSEQLVVFGAIVGVPPELVTPEKLAMIDYENPAAVDAFYDGILAHENMQYVIDDRATPEEPQDDMLRPSCTSGTDAKAYPPRRIVQVAKGFGRNGFVQSICEDDFVPAIDLIVTRIAEAFVPVTE